jgi:hypothetical protein
MALTYIAGYDGTEAASSAVTLARHLAGATGADVIAAVVYEPIPEIYGKGASGMADASSRPRSAAAPSRRWPGSRSRTASCGGSYPETRRRTASIASPSRRRPPSSPSGRPIVAPQGASRSEASASGFCTGHCARS